MVMFRATVRARASVQSNRTGTSQIQRNVDRASKRNSDSTFILKARGVFRVTSMCNSKSKRDHKTKGTSKRNIPSVRARLSCPA